MTRCVIRFAAAVLAAAATIPAASAQDTETVVVTGKRETSTKQNVRFVREIVATDTGQLARYFEPVCPLILGVPQSVAVKIDDRFRRVATAAKVELAAAGCAPNLLAVVAKDADVFIKTMRKRRWSFFENLSDVDIRDAFRPGLVHSWRMTETRDEDGNPLSGDPPTGNSYSSSVFSLPTREATLNAVVVIDKQLVLDKTVAQMADYIAMRTLAGARPPKNAEGTPETILSLFDPNATPPKESTSMDRTFLAGLYAIDADRNAMAQTHLIAREMLRNAESHQAPAKE